MLHGNIKMFIVIFKKMGEENTRGLSWHWRVIVCLFLVRNTILNLNSPKGQISILLIASLLLAAVSTFSKCNEAARKKKTVGKHLVATPADFFVIRKVLNSKFIKCSSSKAAQNSLNFVDTFTRTKVTAV